MKMNKYINEDWLEFLKDMLQTMYIDEIFRNVRTSKGRIYPPSESCFRAFNCCSLKKLKVIILGQDPYYTHDVANGLAFASGKPGYIPPSLKNIFKEAEISNPIFQDLYDWAEQGVLLLNTSLTVEEGNPNSHYTFWKPFTTYTLDRINNDRKNIVVMLWGKEAQKYEHLLSNQIILKAGHPSPLNTSKHKFIGCNHFKKCNQHLEKLGKKPINWAPIG